MKRLAQYSQYFLRNPLLIKQLLSRTSITSEDTVYDIGAGSGVISSVLAKRAKEVVAIEYEPRTVIKLRENMAKHTNVTVRQGDILSMPLPNASFKVFSNIPFHISSKIVRRLTRDERAPVATYLIVQKQFAYKLVPQKDGFTGQLGTVIAPWFEVKVRKRLQRTDFWPHPNVDTVFLEIIKREAPFLPWSDKEAFSAFVEGCYADPKIFAKAPQRAAALPEAIRPSQLTPEQWCLLFRARSR